MFRCSTELRGVMFPCWLAIHRRICERYRPCKHVRDRRRSCQSRWAFSAPRWCIKSCSPPRHPSLLSELKPGCRIFAALRSTVLPETAKTSASDRIAESYGDIRELHSLSIHLAYEPKASRNDRADARLASSYGAARADALRDRRSSGEVEERREILMGGHSIIASENVDVDSERRIDCRRGRAPCRDQSASKSGASGQGRHRTAGVRRASPVATVHSNPRGIPERFGQTSELAERKFRRDSAAHVSCG